GTLGDLLLYALLVGGDYDTRGVEGCGSTTAVALARCGYGEELFEAFKAQLSPDDYCAFLATWRTKLQEELGKNTHGFLARREPKVAGNITDAFPDVNILNSYLIPVTTWTLTGNPVDTSRWLHNEPTLPNISQFCSRFWGVEKMKSVFRSKLWHGILISMLTCKYKHFLTEENRHLKTPHMNTQLISVGPRVDCADLPSIPRRLVTVSTKTFVASMAFSDRSNPRNLPLEIPECLLLGMGLIDDHAAMSSLTWLPMDRDRGTDDNYASTSGPLYSTGIESSPSPIASTSRSTLDSAWLNTTSNTKSIWDSIGFSNIELEPTDKVNAPSDMEIDAPVNNATLRPTPAGCDVIDLTDPNWDDLDDQVPGATTPYINAREVVDLTGPEPVAIRVRTLNIWNFMEILDD
ncbi:hypothetical protein H0H93_009892, partial [Arthromyces matolae]